MNPELNAVIFSGGGADGAYQIGVAKALFNGKSRATFMQPMDPDAFTGTSIGSFNASFLVSHWEDYGAAAVGKLEKVWLERMAWKGASNGGFRVRFNPFELLNPRAYLQEPFAFRPLTQLASDAGVLSWEAINRTYNLLSSDEPLLERLTDFFNVSSFVAVDPWEKTIREEIDYKKIRNSDKKLCIAATNWAFGEVREFKNADMTDKLGPAAIRASSSVPGVYPPAQVGSQSFVDGAVLMNTPLSPAIGALREICREDPYAGLWDLPMREAVQLADQAYENEQRAADPELVLHVVYMNTEVEKMPIDALQNTLKTLYRTQIISWASTVNQDIERAGLLNRGLEYVRGLDHLRSVEAARDRLLAKGKQKKLTKADEAELAKVEKELGGEQLEAVRESVKKMPKKELSRILQAAQSIVERMNEGHPYKTLTIHRYFPPDGLDGALGFLDVRRERFERLIEQGFSDTVAHDCETNGCILSGKHRKLVKKW